MQERAAWLAWAQISGIGPVLLHRLVERFSTLSIAWTAPLDQLETISGIGPTVLKAIATQRSTLDPEQFLDTHCQQNPTFWTPADADYPRLLREIPDPPAVLYYCGNPALLDSQGHNPVVAIVGTRDPSDYAQRWTRKLAKALAQKGITIISGMAEGIDTQAHLGCLDAQGWTIAVLGTGVDVAYPPRNQTLHQRIQARGLVISEYPAGTPPSRPHFPRRNRLIAALSRATLVMEAPQRSGALITAYLANDYGRDVYVLPSTLDNPRATGCLGLMTRGAQLILGEGHLLEQLGALPVLDAIASPVAPAVVPLEVPAPISPPPALSEDLKALWLLVQSLCQDSAESNVSFDRVVQAAGQPAGAVSSGLLQLELLGLMTQLPGMRYAVVTVA